MGYVQKIETWAVNDNKSISNNNYKNNHVGEYKPPCL